MFENIRADAKRYEYYGMRWYRETGFLIGGNYRFGRWAREVKSRFLRRPLVLLHQLTSAPIRIVLGSEVSRDAEIGPGLVIYHGHSVLIPPGTQLGSYCSIFHEVTFGVGPRPGQPRLDDHVVVFSGARILGGITVGAHAEIGACCVVNRDVPAGAAVVSPPPRIVQKEFLKNMREPAQGESQGAGGGAVS